MDLFSRIKRGFATSFEDALGEMDSGSKEDPVVESTSGQPVAKLPSAEGLDSVLAEERISRTLKEVVITSEGTVGPQVRRERGHGATIVAPNSSAKAPQWLLPEAIAVAPATVPVEADSPASDFPEPDDETMPSPLNSSHPTHTFPTATDPDDSLSGSSHLDDSIAEPRTLTMANNLKESLDQLMQIDGASAVALVDANSGMAMGTAGGGPINLEVAAAGNSEVVRAKHKAMKALGLRESIEDILITLNTQYHLIRPLTKAPDVFIYLVLSRSNSNLAMARHKLASVEKDLQI